MISLRRLDDALRDLLRLGRIELVLRLLILLPVGVFLLAVEVVGSAPVWMLVVAVLCGLMTVLAPDSDAGALTSLFLLAVWYFGNQTDPYSLWTLVAALALLALHVATAAATRAPGTSRLPRGSLRPWTVRTAVVAGVTVVAYVVGRVITAIDATGSVVLTTAAGLAAAGLVLAARRWSMGPPGR